jgi:purine-binding chemotaxis protein CheW
MAEECLYCTFFLGQQFYGIPVQDVQEVLLSQPLTGVPLAPPAVVGLMNLRGQIVTAVDARRMLRVTDPLPPDHEPMNLVVRHEGAEVSLLVDRIGDVIDVAGSVMERPPDTLQMSTRSFLAGIFALEQRLLLVLDVHRMLEDDYCTRLQAAD